MNHEIEDMVNDKFPKTIWATDSNEAINAIARRPKLRATKR